MAQKELHKYFAPTPSRPLQRTLSPGVVTGGICPGFQEHPGHLHGVRCSPQCSIRVLEVEQFSALHLQAIELGWIEVLICKPATKVKADIIMADTRNKRQLWDAHR